MNLIELKGYEYIFAINDIRLKINKRNIKVIIVNILGVLTETI